MRAIELFQVNIQRSEELVKFHKDRFPVGRPVSKGLPADLLRAVVVFMVAALDSYIHKRIIEVLKQVLVLKKRIPEECINLVTKRFKDNDKHRQILNIAIQKNPINKIIHLTEESVSLMTFQKPKEIELLFDVGEIKNPWKQINELIKPSKGKKRKGRNQEAKKILLDLAKRRDEIAHKNDMYVGNKYHGKIKSINRKGVNENLVKLIKIVYAIEKISNKQT